MNHTIYAVIPVKDPCKSKTRLSDILNVEARKKLTLLMLEDVISTLKCSKLLTGVIVVSPSLDVLELGKSLNCEIVKEGSKSIGLNRAVKLGVEYGTSLGAEAVLILPADIPMINLEDIEKIVLTGLILEKPYVVISPSKDGGTNALMLSLPTQMSFKFGPNSYTLHLREAEKTKSNVRILHLESVMMDIDSGKDIDFFLRSFRDGKRKKSWLYLRETL